MQFLGYANIVEELLVKHADIAVKNKGGNSPIHLAALHSKFANIQNHQV